MYDELVKRLHKRIALTTAGSPLQDDLKEAADAIEELLQKMQQLPRWIPVTERLPKMIDGENISKDVYVTDGTEIAKACIMRDYDGVVGWTYTGIGKITHWCERIPLPEPPKEET